MSGIRKELQRQPRMDLFRDCPNPTGNPKCKKRMYYVDEGKLSVALTRNGLCNCCKKLRSDRADVIRICPNPKENPNCKKTLTYSDVWAKDRGEKAKAVCRSCLMYGIPKSKEHTEKIKRIRLGMRMSEEARRKISKATKGNKNPMYGKSPPKESTRSIGGWYKGIHFRSSNELLFLMTHDNIDWKSAEFGNYKVIYKTEDGKVKTYRPDFVGDGFVVEVKPLGWTASFNFHKDVGVKSTAAYEHFERIGMEYVIAEMPSIKKNKIFELRDNNVIILQKRWERKYQEWAQKIG